MPIRSGLTSLSAIKLGTTTVQKVYLGTTQIYPNAVVGVNGFVSDFQPEGSLVDSYSLIRFNSNGTMYIEKSDGGITPQDGILEGWYVPTTADIWSNYWVRATSDVPAGVGRAGTLNTWIKLDTYPQWSVTVPYTLSGLSRDWELTFEFSLSNGGPVVSIPSTVILSASVGAASGPGPGGGGEPF